MVRSYSRGHTVIERWPNIWQPVVVMSCVWSTTHGARVLYFTEGDPMAWKRITAPGDDKVKMKGYLVLPQTPTVRCDLNGAVQDLRISLQVRSSRRVLDSLGLR